MIEERNPSGHRAPNDIPPPVPPLGMNWLGWLGWLVVTVVLLHPILLQDGSILQTIVQEGIPLWSQAAPDPLSALPPPLPLTVPSPAVPSRTQYHIIARLDYPTHHLYVEQGISYLNQTGETLTAFPLVIEANQETGVFQLDSLSGESDTLIQRFILEGTQLQVHLTNPLLAGEVASLTLRYRLALPPRAAYLGHTARQMLVADWYPYLPPYRDSRWHLNEPAAVGEHLAYDLADYHVELSIDGAPDGLVVAASALPYATYPALHYHVQGGRNFTWSASREYVPLIAEAGDTLVRGYVFPEHQQGGEAVLRVTTEAILLYERLFGPYPHGSLTFVEAEIDDGREYQGLYFLSDSYFSEYEATPSNSFLLPLAAHETAHQWWYGIVGNDPAITPWLDEALATYSELLFFERYYPDQVEWWWEFRVNRFNPTGHYGATIYEFSDYRSYVDSVYLEGTNFLHHLRRSLGDESFLAFLQSYLANTQGHLASEASFFDTLAPYLMDDEAAQSSFCAGYPDEPHICPQP